MNDKIIRAVKGTSAAGCLFGSFVFGGLIVKQGAHPLFVAIFAGLTVGGAILGKQAVLGYKEGLDG